MITAHPSAPEGLVLHLATYSPGDFIAPCAVLCRNTAPLVSFAYSLLQRDIPCTILGRDIGAQLRKIVENMRAESLEDLETRLAAWLDRELARCDRDNVSPERICDQHACLRFFINGLDESSRTVASLLAKIDLMFTDDTTTTNRVILATIHRVKGLEWPLVFILDRSLIPSKYATLPWQRQQERNLLYVAITRAMQKLVYISSNCWKTS